MLTVTEFKKITQKDKYAFDLLCDAITQELKKEKSNTDKFLSIYTEKVIYTFYNPILIEKIKKQVLLVYSFKIKKTGKDIEFLSFDVLILQQYRKNYFYTRYNESLPKQLFIFDFIEQFKKQSKNKYRIFAARKI